jgi:hypothetical protein
MSTRDSGGKVTRRVPGEEGRRGVGSEPRRLNPLLILWGRYGAAKKPRPFKTRELLGCGSAVICGLTGRQMHKIILRHVLGGSPLSRLSLNSYRLFD